MQSEVIATIVSKLKAPPFRKRLTLVTFDELSNAELLAVLNDVVVYLDPSHTPTADLGHKESKERTGTRIAQFLHTMKFQYPSNRVNEFKSGIENGERGTVYPVLHYLLTRLPQVKKRAYLANFLVNIDVPTEFLQDNMIKSTYDHYKKLQKEFKDVHKIVDKSRTTNLAPSELKSEIRQLEDERLQLMDKITKLKRKTSSAAADPRFKALLEATSALRREQEEETKLSERKHEQMEAAERAAQRGERVSASLQELESSPTLEMSPEQLLESIRKRVAQKRARVKEILPREMRRLHDASRRAESSVPKTEEDVRHLEDQIRDVDRKIRGVESHIASKRRESKRGDDDEDDEGDKLRAFRQQASMVKKKLAQKKERLRALKEESEELKRKIDDKESMLSEMSGRNGTFMKRDEFKDFATKLRTKTTQYKQAKAELGKLRSESVTLSRTEQILRGRDENLQELLTKIEEKKGVSGYLNTQRELAKISQLKNTTDQLKGKTLEEISEIVRNINRVLKERESSLKPKVQELRQIRSKYREIKMTFDSKRKAYDNAAAGLESDRISLERDAHHMQEEAIRIESKYHLLNAKISLSQSRMGMVEREREGIRGRDQRTYKEMYENKLTQQMALTKVLHRRQKELKENVEENTMQRDKFKAMLTLLKAKLDTKRTDEKGSDDGDSDGGSDEKGYESKSNVMSFV